MGSSLAPKHLQKQEFGRRVYRLMNEKGWHQSELARKANLNRAAISTYINGRVLPTPTHLKSLAEALGVQAEQLLPNHAEKAIEDDSPSFELKVSPGAPNTAWVRVNRLVSLGTAVKIANLLENDDALNRGGSRSDFEVQSVEGEAIKTSRASLVLSGKTSSNSKD